MGFRGPEALKDNLEHRWDCQTPQDLEPVSEKSLLRRVPSQVTVIGDTFSVVRRSAKKPKKWRKTVARINVAKMLCGRVLQRSCAETGSHAGQIHQDSRFLSDESRPPQDRHSAE